MSGALDRVFIQGLTVEARIGVHAYEMPLRQRLVLDLEMSVDLASSAASGQLEETIDYKAVAEAIRALANDRHFALVESLAEAAARIILEEFGALAVRIVVAKPGAVRGTSTVGVILERTRRAIGPSA